MNNMNNNKKFIISSELFNGFNIDIDVNFHDSIETILDYTKKIILEILKKNNFENLIDILNKSKLHIHNFTFEDILISKRNTIYYICDMVH